MRQKGKIRKYVAEALVGFTLFTGGCITVREATIDHTEELCPITKILNIINPKDSSPLGVMLHQIPAMQKDYEKKGIDNVAITYKSYKEEHSETVYAKPIGKKISNDTTQFIAPEGYELYIENGKYKCRKVVTDAELHHELVADAPYAKRLKID